VKDGLQKTVVYTILGIVIMTALMTVTSITTPIEGVYIQLAYGYLALFAGVAGALPAAIVGFTGHVLFDLINTDHLWISWAISSAALGFTFGFAIRRNSLRQGVFSKHDMIRFNAHTGELNVLVNEAEFNNRSIPEANLSCHTHGIGRELFAGFRSHTSSAETGAMSFGGDFV